MLVMSRVSVTVIRTPALLILLLAILAPSANLTVTKLPKPVRREAAIFEERVGANLAIKPAIKVIPPVAVAQVAAVERIYSAAPP